MSRLFFCILFLLFISACANTPNKSKQNIILSDDGLSEISLQKNWRKQHNLNQVASIQAADMQRELYLIVISEQVDPSRGISLTDYSRLTVSNIANNLEQAAITDQHELIIDGQKAIQTEVRGIINNIGIHYISTAIAGKNAYHHVLSWTLASLINVNRDRLVAATDGFSLSDNQRNPVAKQYFQFDWPQDLHAEVEFKITDEKIIAGESDRKVISGHYDLATQGQKNHLLVSSNNTSITVEDASEEQASNEITNMLAQLTAQTPSFLVTPQGTFHRIVDAEPMRKKALTIVNKKIDELAPNRKSQIRQNIEKVLSDSTISTLLNEYWNELVGYWADGTMAQGETIRASGTYQLPMLHDKQTEMEITYEFIGNVPCTDKDMKKSCVHLRTRSIVNADNAREAMGLYLSDVAQQKVNIHSMSIQSIVDLVSDPHTLLPYSVTKTKSNTLNFDISGQKTTTEKIEVYESSFKYKKRGT